MKTDIILFQKVSFLDILLFTKHASVMLKSGITITETVDILANQTKSSAFKKVLTMVLKDLRNGQPVAKSLKKQGEVFDQFYCSLIEVGEESGTLSNSLDYLAKQLAKEYALQKKVQGALLYPAIVLSAVGIVGVGMSLFVFPKLIDLFNSLDTQLPPTTQAFLFFATLIKNHGITILISTIVIATLLRLSLRIHVVKYFWHKLLLSMPIFGPLLTDQELTRFCRNLGIMLKSGLSITKALAVEYNATHNLVFKNYVKKLQHSVDRGKSLEEELSSSYFSNFSEIATRMIGVGEKTGKLDEVLQYLGDFFEDEVDNTAKNLSVVLEPLVLLLIGLIVGFVAMAIISPIYNITGSIKR